MNRLLCGSLALMLASAAFASPQEPGTGPNPPAKTTAKQRGKGTRAKHRKTGGDHIRTGNHQTANAQPAGK